jgi:hypothetical protein
MAMLNNQRLPETFDCGAILGNSLQISSHLPWFLTEMMMWGWVKTLVPSEPQNSW